ncbi:MAG: DUF6515 family protein [Xenococcaceae cyanobacterium MO_207.B15]|nr:DUF6515 family protein [Xenococcaceae cyanobacterium MO_207.B15]
MKNFSRRRLATLFSLLLFTTLLPLDIAFAQLRGGVGGRGSRSRGASPRINSNIDLQNRGNISSPSRNRSQYQQNRQNTLQNRQGERTERQGNRQITQQDRQGERSERTEIRQGESTERTEIRQGERTERQDNRQDFIDDNYYRGRWYGGGWYGGGYYVPPGWGWVGFTTGLIIGATIATPPPYYSTIYVGSTTYIYSDGIFFQPSGSSYTVVRPPVGAVVTYLPEGCSMIQINNLNYYNCSDIYYQPVYRNGSVVYKVVDF